MSATTSTSGKRSLNEIGGHPNGHPSPLKKRRMNAYLTSIERDIPILTDSKLRANPEASSEAADDSLFLSPLGSANEKYTRWVLACKFTIAASWKVDDNRIPEQMHFFVDDQQNFCALISNALSETTKDVVNHCRQIETSVVRRYRRRRTDGGSMSDSEESADDDLPAAAQYETVFVVRIPSVYYARNLQSSFYALCCRTAQHLQRTQHYGHSLFRVLFKNIANFDSFQLSVPTVPLRGSLYRMFCQFGLGVRDHHEVKRHHVLNRRDFATFLGLYDCWKEGGRRAQCRKSMYQCWHRATGTGVHVMGLVVEWAGLDEMDEASALKWAESLDRKSAAYRRYKAELRAQMANLKVIVDFNSK